MPDASLSDGERRAIADAVVFAGDVVLPNAQGWEHDRAIPPSVLHDAAAAGLMGLLVPEAHGGRALGLTAMARVMEELAAACMAFAFSLVVHNNLCGAIARHGSAKLIGRHLPALLAGRRIGAFLLTEPGAGSDAAAITTTASRVAGGWRLDGEKAWVSNAARAGLLSVYAQTDAAAGWRGIAGFLVDPQAPGVTATPPYELLGGHALGTGGFVFTGCVVDDDSMLMPPEVAFKAAMQGIDLARVNVAAMCCGMLRTGLETALAYAAERQAFGQSTLSFQGLQWMLADAETELRAARLLTFDAARRVTAADGAAPAAAHAKKFATRVALARLIDCMQAMGAEGYRARNPLARHLAGAKMAQFLDGTSEIQNVVIARDQRRRLELRTGT